MPLCLHSLISVCHRTDKNWVRRVDKGGKPEESHRSKGSRETTYVQSSLWPRQHPIKYLMTVPPKWHKDLLVFLQRSVDTGVLPEDWTRASINQYSRKGTDAENDRPVSLTSVTCKLLKYIMRRHLHDHLDEPNLIATDSGRGLHHSDRNKRPIRPRTIKHNNNLL